MVKATLIDLDGFLVNSEELYLEANKLYFDPLGMRFTEKHHREGTGRRFEEWIKTVVNIDKSGEEILKERNLIFFKLVKTKLRLLPGARNFLNEMKQNFKTALVTSSKKDYVDLVFDITKIQDFFDLVITGELPKKGKPDPDCYLLAAKKLNVKTSECVVFEDAPNGVLAGKNAGMRVVAIPSKYVEKDPTFEKADLVLSSFSELSLEKIRSL